MAATAAPRWRLNSVMRKRQSQPSGTRDAAGRTIVDANAAASSGSTVVLAGVVACFVLSGFAALLYQTAWLRQFSLVFGTSELAVATVLAAYMAGLAGGAAVAGRWIHRVRRPIRVYGFLEAGIAISSLAVPLLLSAAGAAYVALLGDRPMPPDAGTLGQPVFYLVVAFLVLALPTGFMGATLPLLIRQVVSSDRELGPRIAMLYAANTAGAVAGTIAAAFFLLPAFGLSATVWIGVAINAAVFGLAAFIATQAPAPSVAPDSGSQDRREADCPKGFVSNCVAPLVTGAGRAMRDRVADVFRSQPAWILLLMFFSGANSFLYEVLWTRMLSHVLGGSIYAFATMLAAFLTGIAFGGGLAGAFAKDRRSATSNFAITQVAIALLSIGIYQWMGFAIPDARSVGRVVGIRRRGHVAGDGFYRRNVAAGRQDSWPRRRDRRVPATARVYAWNTAGARS